MKMAPGHSSGAAEIHLPARGEWPAVDDYLDEPETTRWERVGGQRVWASPSKLEHAAPHMRLDYLVAAHARPGYVGASDLKTRVSDDDEFASDTCLLKDGIDPRTGRRYLEELSFEIVNKRSQAKVDARARAFAARGVRRQIAINVRTGTVSEWDKTKGKWRPLDPKRRIHDKCLARPLEVAALLDAARADDEVARALEAKGNPAIEEMKTKSHARGFEEGRREGIKDLCRVLDIPWSVERDAAVKAMSLSALEALWEHLVDHKKWPEEEATED